MQHLRIKLNADLRVNSLWTSGGPMAGDFTCQHRICPKISEIGMTDMTIHLKALEEHFLMVLSFWMDSL
jgi:hypothetical protein